MFNEQDPLEYKNITTLTHNDGNKYSLTFREKVQLATEIDELVRRKVIEFWEKRRIKFDSQAGNRLYGRRGSIWWNMVTFDMSKLKTELTITFDDKARCVECEVDVNTQHQHITLTDQEYFTEELNSFASYLKNNDERQAEWKDFKKRHRRSNLLWVLAIIAIAAILGSISGAIKGIMDLIFKDSK